MKKTRTYPVIIVGAGPAGIGMSHVLHTAGIEHIVLERHSVGSSFARWPKQMRFISPSFTGNSFGSIDLNAVTPETSPAFSLKTEHPTGVEYQRYLDNLTQHYALPVKEGVEVTGIRKVDEGYAVETSDSRYHCRFIVWAGGEFQFPNDRPFPGAEHCRHVSTIHSYETIPEGEHYIIGGYESGFDVGAWLLAHGRSVTLIDRGQPWENHGSDSSTALSPYTRDKLHAYVENPRLTVVPNRTVKEVRKAKKTYEIVFSDGTSVQAPHPPILATGFVGSAMTLLKEQFEWTTRGRPLLSSSDESTIASGIFLVGSHVEHGGAIFCFIYKFRQRFAIIAEEIAERMRKRSPALEEYKKIPGFYLKDFSRCGDECAC